MLIEDITLMLGVTSIVLGILSVVLAVCFFREGRRRERAHERFFMLQVKENIKRMSAYFLTVESETKYGEDDEDGGDESVSSIMESLHTFYTRHEQEMKDTLSQTRLYLPLWKSLSEKDRAMVDNTLDLFSWLLYEYYNQTLPQSLRTNKVLESRGTLNANVYAVAENARRITQCP